MKGMVDVDKILKDHEKRIQALEKKSSSSKTVKPSSKKSLVNLLEDLKQDGFFNSAKGRKEIVDKLAEFGAIYPSDSLNKPLLKAVRSRILGRVQKDGQWKYVRR